MIFARGAVRRGASGMTGFAAFFWEKMKTGNVTTQTTSIVMMNGCDPGLPC